MVLNLVLASPVLSVVTRRIYMKEAFVHLVAWGPGLINPSKTGHVNKASVFSAVDLVPTLLEITGTSPLRIPTMMAKFS